MDCSHSPECVRAPFYLELNFISDQCSSEHKLPFLRQNSRQVIILTHVFAHLSGKIKSLSKICRSPMGEGISEVRKAKTLQIGT